MASIVIIFVEDKGTREEAEEGKKKQWSASFAISIQPEQDAGHTRSVLPTGDLEELLDVGDLLGLARCQLPRIDMWVRVRAGQTSTTRQQQHSLLRTGRPLCLVSLTTLVRRHRGLSFHSRIYIRPPTASTQSFMSRSIPALLCCADCAAVCWLTGVTVGVISTHHFDWLTD